MGVKLTKKLMKQWCGSYAYQKGERLSRANKVRFVQFDSDADKYTAEVSGANRHEVSLSFDPDGKPDVQCNCPKLGSFHAFCHHIAAVFIRLYEIQQTGNGTASGVQIDDARPAEMPAPGESARPGNFGGFGNFGDSGGLGIQPPMADRILGLFEELPVRPLRNKTIAETRRPLEVEFQLKLQSYNRSTALFGIELKIGPKALYIVRNIASFLDQLDRGESYSFSAKFSYDPELHSFSAEDEAVLQALIEVAKNDDVYRKTDRLYPVYTSGLNRDRTLPLPPKAWLELIPLLAQAPKVTLIDGDTRFDGVSITDDLLPLRFEFMESISTSGQGQFELVIHGLESVTMMEPYGMVFQGGQLYRLKAKSCKRLSELIAIVADSGTNRIMMQRGQMESFIEKAVPGLKKLGSVIIAPAIAEHITQAKLQARLYLDRVKDRLLAAVEFQYDEITINPLEDIRSQPDSHRILIRDVEREQRILELIEQCPFLKTESGYVMSEEEAEFDFLYQVIPQLEKLLKVYATSAVKLRLVKSDTLPKISVRVAVADKLNWLEFRLNMDWIPETEIRSLIQSIEEKRRYYRLPNGSLMPLDGAEFQEFAEFLKETGLINTDFAGSKVKVPLTRGIQWLDHSFNGLKLDKPLRLLLDHLRNPNALDFPIPAQFTEVLRDYQKLGYQWLKTLAHYGFGGILADDMGLGKTVQSIALIASNLTEIRQRRVPALVICPGSLVYNWHNELRKFAPDIRVLIADGSRLERAAKIRALEDADVVITSYPLLLRDLDHYAKHPFHTLLLDEAQVVKNYATQTAQAVKSIQADYRFALTGTPIENRLEDLWSIFNVIFPALFQDLKTFGNLTNREVSKRIRPFMLRRWKNDVLQDLPDKTESIRPIELLPEQKKLYAAYLAKLQQETLKHLSVDGYHKNRIKILAGLTRLRQICCHPALFVQGYGGRSAKLEQLKELVEECLANRKRILIFSQFTGMLRLIGREMSDQGLPFFYLDGTTPARERVELCSRFNEGEMDLFLISLKAGGTGLNLTGADTVILYDLWWNPAVEQQAADRAHRIGQKNVVQIIRLITQGTMEEKMYELQHRKKHLISNVLDPHEEAVSTLTEQELREILMI